MTPRIIMDDIKCARILTDEGLLDKLTKSEGSNMAATFFQRDECYCMAVKHWGHKEAHDNGFIIVMLPKARISQYDAAVFFTEAINESKDEWASIHESEFDLSPLENS